MAGSPGVTGTGTLAGLGPAVTTGLGFPHISQITLNFFGKSKIKKKKQKSEGKK